MALQFCSFASGSSGNSYLVKSNSTALIIDVGISGKKIFTGIEQNGIDPKDIDGILITHEHLDHIKSLRVVGKKCSNAKVYSNIGTWEFIKDKVEDNSQIVFETGRDFTVGDIQVRAFAVSHDAVEPVSYSFRKDGKQVSILTDTGNVDEDVYREIKDADLLALEANHDPKILQFCRYPYHIKRRILGDEGHLSNEAAALCLSRLAEEGPKKRQILLSHLSKENNTPEMALITVENIMDRSSHELRDRLKISVLQRDAISPLYFI